MKFSTFAAIAFGALMPTMLPAAPASASCPGQWDYGPPGNVSNNGLITRLREINGDLYICGGFTHFAGVASRGLVRWDGSQVHGYADLIGIVRDVAMFNGELYATGNFSLFTGGPFVHIARWNGIAWVGLGSGLNDQAYALAVYDGALHVGGRFWEVDGQPAQYIARWDGNQWSNVGAANAISGHVFAVTVHNGELVIGGSFILAAGQTVNRIARWNGSQWLPLDTGVGGAVYSLSSYNGEMIAGGGFTTAGGQPANRIARWDGSQWHAIGSGVGTGSDWVEDVAQIGADLYATGWFTQLGSGQPAAYIARWSGAVGGWHALGGGLSALGYTLIEHNGRLIVGGNFMQAGAMALDRLASWELTGQPPSITSQPPTALSAQQGDAFTLEVQATGEPPLSYQWHFDGQPIPGDFFGVVGTQTNSVVINQAAEAFAGVWHVMIAGPCGVEVSDSTQVSVTTGPSPSCPADLNGDLAVDVLDMLALFAAWGPCP